VRAGFGSGYFTYAEHPARLAATHFSAHGPGFPLVYGSLGRLAAGTCTRDRCSTWVFWHWQRRSSSSWPACLAAQ
jgi:hypothetical protein